MMLPIYGLKIHINSSLTVVMSKDDDACSLQSNYVYELLFQFYWLDVRMLCFGILL